LFVKMNGKNSQNKQKFKCKKCNFCFIKKNNKYPKIRWEIIFNERIKEWYSGRQLSNQKIKSKKEITKFIREKLDENQLFQIDLYFENIFYVMIDWTWISKDICLIIYYEYVTKKIIRFGFYDWEKYEYIKNDLEVLKNEFKYKIECFVVDWGKQIKKAIEFIYPNSKIQRCLTHIHRQIDNFIWRNPKHESWKELQKIVTFKNFENKDLFIKKFNNWSEKWADYLWEKSYSKNNNWWYKHKKIRACKSHIKNWIPYMFFYLKDDNIKRSSNDLEWLNWVISDQIYNHRGLRKDRLISFISLLIYNRNL